jgi:hypothetical protein
LITSVAYHTLFYQKNQGMKRLDNYPHNPYNKHMEKTYEQAFNEGVEEGIVIERIRIKGLIDEYIENPDVDLSLLLEWIDEV